MCSQLQFYDKRLYSPFEDVMINKKKNYELTKALGQDENESTSRSL